MGHTKNYRWACDQLAMHPYELIHWAKFDYTILKYINTVTRAGSKKNGKQVYNDCFIMADTETSKKDKKKAGPNHVCAWSIAIRAYSRNVVCLYGSRPDDFCTCLSAILKQMPGEHTIVYFHNLAYDYVFLRRFLFAEFGTPKKQLNTKPYYPISIEFKNGLKLRDSLILSQCKLEKWAKDLNVEHQKAVGKWDYNKVRDQLGNFTKSELLYIQNDVLAGVECLDTLCQNLHKHVYSMPYTATGIPRDETRRIGKKFHAHDLFKKCCNDWTVQMLLEILFHGGYTHCNRNIAGWLQELAICYDFTSSYPYSMLVNKFPMDKFRPYDDEVTPEQILKHEDEYAFMFCVSATNVRMKDPNYPMPTIQKSKLLKQELAVEDNGRVTHAAFASMIYNEYDLKLFLQIYDYDQLRITDVHYAKKDYLPRWFTDYVYQLFIEKSKLKGIDPIQYAISKAKLNSCYGMCVQRPCRIDIKEDYDTGTYYEDPGSNLQQKYEESYMNNYDNVLSYSWGVWVTSESMYRLFQLSTCIDGEWLYSDTDSIYATGWNEKKLKKFNNEIRKKLKERGYPPIEIDGKEFYLGVATFDGQYNEWVGLGAKRYCGRSEKDGELHITVSGVPKAGVKSLKNDINNFKPGLRFSGAVSGKKQHTYYLLDKDMDVYTDPKGNLTGDSIDLAPCDYLLDSPYGGVMSWEEYNYTELFLPELTEDYIYE